MDQINCLSQAVNELRDKINCPICFDVLTDSVLTKCKHHFCSECFKKLFKGRGSQHCPVCHASITRRSCAKNIGSLNKIVNAANELVENLVEDTGIDFSKETVIPSSSREALCSPNTAEKTKNKIKHDVNLTSKIKETKNLIPKNKNLKQYHRKTLSEKVEDSFIFPADFILPKKPLEKTVIESPSSKVSTWLTENENDLKEHDELSILNGSLPKKSAVVDLNVSSSEEELLSVSQVDVTSKTHLQPLKIKTNLVDIAELSENDMQAKVEPSEFKDPYQFISSQKSNQVQNLKKTQKRKSYGNKRKPLGLDISRLVNEPYKKKKNLGVYDTSFQVPVGINDTFDQLLPGYKKSSANLNSKEESITRTSAERKEKREENFLIFKSQSDSIDTPTTQTTLSDFSSGSDDDWAPTVKKRVQKVNVPKVTRLTKPKILKVKATRMLDSTVKKMKSEEEEKIIENINKTFEEIQDHKLMTSSQVLKEDIAKKEVNVHKENKIDCDSERKRKLDDKKINAMMSPERENNCSSKNEVEHSNSPGWSRVNHFRKELSNDVNLKRVSTKRQIDKTSHLQLSNSCSKRIKVVKEDTGENEKLVGESTSVSKQLQLSSMNNNVSRVQNQNSYDKECDRENNDLHSPVHRKQTINISSPEEPVRFLNLSQSQERAAIMNRVVKAYELSLKDEEEALQPVISGESNICVSRANLPDEDENVIENCLKLASERREHLEKWGKLGCVLNTPISVVMTCGSETLEKNRDMCDELSQMPNEISQNMEATVLKETGNGNELISSKRMAEFKCTTSGISKSSFVSESDDSSKTIEKRNSTGFTKAMSSNHENFSLGERIFGSSIQKPCEINQAADKEINVLKPSEEINQSRASTERRKRGILLVRTAEGTVEAENSMTEKFNEDRSYHVGRRVHFNEMPFKEHNSLQSDARSRQSVIFLKAGSCSSRYSRPVVRFLFLGSCRNETDKQCEDQWIIKISKTFPVCHCGNIKTNFTSGKNDDYEQINTSLKGNEEKRENVLIKSKDNEMPVVMKGNQTVSSINNDHTIILPQNAEKIICKNLECSTNLNNNEKNNKFPKSVFLNSTDKVILSENIPVKNSDSISSKDNCKSSDAQTQVHIKNSGCHDTGLPLEVTLNENHSSNSIQNVRKISRTGEEIEIGNRDSLGTHIYSEMNSNKLSDNFKNSKPYISGEVVKSNHGSVSLQKKTSDDIFQSYQNNDKCGLSCKKDDVKVSGDIFDSDEGGGGILPYQEPLEKVSDNIVSTPSNIHSDSSVQKKIEKSDSDVFVSDYNKGHEILFKKPVIVEKVNQNDSILLQNNDVCSTDEDIFQSDDTCFIPPFQEICSSAKVKEILSENDIASDDSNSKISLRSQIKLSIEKNILRDEVNYSNKSDLKHSAKTRSVSSSKICESDKDVFITEQSKGSSSVKKSPKNNEKFMPGENLKSNCLNLIEDDSGSDEDSNTKCKTSLINDSEHSSKNRKRARPLKESSDDSDYEEKIPRKTNPNLGSTSSLVKSVGNVLQQSKLSKMKSSSNEIRQDYPNTEDEDYLLNSEELLQMVLNNINEDLGKSDKQVTKLRGAKKRLSSDSEDEPIKQCDLRSQKLSNNDEQDVIDEDEDVFTDTCDNDVDIIEGTPRKSKTCDSDVRHISPEIINLAENVQDDDENISEPAQKKIVLSHCTSNAETKYAELETLKKPQQSHHIKEDFNERMASAKTKKSVLTPSEFETPQKHNLENNGNSTLNSHTRVSPKNENHVQKLTSDIDHKVVSTISKDEHPSRHKMVFVCSGLPVRLVTLVKKFASEIGAGFSDNFTISMTHLIVNVDENQATPKTFKYLLAVASKKWVVSYNWIAACISANKIVPEDDFEAIDTVGLDGPRRSRLSCESLFKNFQACFIEPFQNITVDKLQEIFMMCGGMVIDSPEGFSIVNNKVIRIIIVDNDAEVDAALCHKWITRNRAVTLNYDWLVDCVGTHTILPVPSSFAVPYTREEVLACGIPEVLLDEDDLEVTGVSDMGSQAEP